MTASQPRRARRLTLSRVLTWLADAVLTVAAALGTLSILLVLASWIFKISLILFSTGSMSPAIPAGSLAIVREIPASEITVGSVVTVTREDDLPLSHRVISVEPGPTPETRVIQMKGDANPVPDAETYTVEHVRLILVSFPGLARPVAMMSNPPLMIWVTVGTAVLVGWALWPRSARATAGAAGGAGPVSRARRDRGDRRDRGRHGGRRGRRDRGGGAEDSPAP